MITLQSVQAARARISPYVVRTPTVVQGRLTELLGRPVVAKLELLQHAGSFKARGAFNRMLDLSDDERGAGVVAVSGGNHGLAVAFAARELGVSAKVIMPASTPAGSIAGARGRRERLGDRGGEDDLRTVGARTGGVPTHARHGPDGSRGRGGCDRP